MGRVGAFEVVADGEGGGCGLADIVQCCGEGRIGGVGVLGLEGERREFGLML